MGKILIFGATGTLGLPICKYLKNKGYDVLAIGHSSNGEKLFNQLNIECQKVDISDINTFDVLPTTDVECVMNFAGCLPAMMGQYAKNSLYPDTIIKGCINILDYMRKINCKKIIFPQSVYDVHYLFGSSTPIPADADRKTIHKGDHSIYVTCKNATIDILKYYGNTYGIKSTVLRLPGIYQYHPKPYILINGKKGIKLERVWIEKAKKGEPLEIWGDPKRVLESICIEDFLQIVEKSINNNKTFSIYNVGNGGTSIEQKVLDIKDVFCNPNNISEIIYLPNKSNSTQYILDIEKTKNELGYEPKYTWHDYLVSLKWHMENQPNKDIWGSFEEYYPLLTNIKSDGDRFEK